MLQPNRPPPHRLASYDSVFASSLGVQILIFHMIKSKFSTDFGPQSAIVVLVYSCSIFCCLFISRIKGKIPFARK